MDNIDAETVAYILETRRPFEDLRQVAAELAGLLVLAASGAQTAAPDHPMLEAAGRLFDESAGAIRSSRATARAQRHHRHLMQAADYLGNALVSARDTLGRTRTAGDNVDEVLRPLRAGYEHLRLASLCLPGFRLVAFDLSCAGACGPARPRP